MDKYKTVYEKAIKIARNIDNNFKIPTTDRKEGYYYIVRVNKHLHGTPRYLREELNTYLMTQNLVNYIAIDKYATTDINRAARFYTKDFTKDEVLSHAKRYVKHLRFHRTRENVNKPNLTQYDDIELIKRRCHYHKSYFY